MRDHSKVMLVALLLAACVGCSSGPARHVLPDAGPNPDATADGAARNDAASDANDAADASGASDATDGSKNDDGGADQTTFGCGDASCRAPAEYCRGTEGPGTAPNRYLGCGATPAACRSNYTCACLQANTVSATNCIEADGGATTLTGLP